MPNVFRFRDAKGRASSVENRILFAGCLPFLLSTISVLATGHSDRGDRYDIGKGYIGGFYLIGKDRES